ncbi:leucine-rich repeat domain-containing protein [Cerasicoccus maritimus]|uniref:leucine-rich repeat domain-containing protein n=1 Tax=Cerasicoccus maritimus TaxID=490089 RepID=UPI002852504C|nr:leucine-rich repeat domain-containing protein [Cerasicoccus maritimus]
MLLIHRIIFLVSLYILSVVWASAAQSGSFLYFDYGDTAAIYDVDGVLEGDLVIPDTLDGKTVTRLDIASFADQNITSVTIPSSVTHIGLVAFNNCALLETVTLSEGLEEIGEWAFANCSQLDSINLPASLTLIDEYAFHSCSSLTSLALPDATLQIEYGAFIFSGLTSIHIPASVNQLAGGVFSNCHSLTSITVAEESTYFTAIDNVLYDKQVTRLINYPIADPATSFDVPPTVTTIASWSFVDCSQLQTINLPEGLLDIEHDAFAMSNAGISSITLPSTLLTIGEYAFNGTLITSVYIPSSVTELYRNSFGNISYTVSPSNATYASQDFVLYNKSMTELIAYPSASTATTFALPDTVEVILDSAMSGASNLTSIELAESLRIIESSAFSGCTGIQQLILPSSLEELESQIFSFTAGMEDLEIYFLGAAPTTPADFYFFTYSDSLGYPEPTVYFFSDQAGFTTPTWFRCPSIDMGPKTTGKMWLVEQELSYDTDIATATSAQGEPLIIPYALDYSPTESAQPEPVPADGNKLELTYFANREGVTYTVLASENLSSWSTDGVTISPPNSDGYSTASVDLGDQPKFLLIDVQLD